jgi:DNA-binding CsgD family transcriptional regulator
MVAVDPTTVGLSARQRAVLSLSATGLLPVDVGVALQIPVDDVREQLMDAGRRLGAGSKLEAVVIAHRRGLIDL